MAVLDEPLVRLKSASSPSAVLELGYPPSGGGLTECAIGRNPRDIIRATMRDIIRALLCRFSRFI
jgi:hypothetical protein